ncbi:MAG: tetratricopeptide repeat protein, partial [Acidobacteria bacterium]|nr:tetratricopeptide repeat protein [Acidobacteriota bacterium]
MNAGVRPGGLPAPQEDLTGTQLGRYQVVAKLGEGGMGEVYQAQDTTLRRSVALKRLAPHLAGDQAQKHRLLREARAASALNHPNIATLFDVLEAGGETYLVMELVAGEPLRSRLGRPLALDECLHIARQCAEALEAAHSRGIVHRDIKPENILLSPDGRVKILDFGIAQRLPLDDADTATTETATVRGTLRYLAPEVLEQGEPDGRADLFSLGVVLYEMLTGRHPFEAPTASGLLARILTETPAPPSRHNPDVSPEVDRIVTKLLARDPAQRYPAARALLGDLEQLERQPVSRGRRWLTTRRAALLAAGVAVVAVVLLHQGRRAPEASARYLAIEPFKSLAEDPETSFFADGFTEALIARLAGLGGIYVVPATADIGASLVLEGGVQRSGDRLRITYRLVDRKRRVSLGGDVLDGQVAEIFTLQDRLTADIGRRLRAQFGLATSYAAHAPPTENITAYDFYLQARGYLARYDQEDNVDIAAELFQRALAQDPQFALAQAGLGEAYWRKYEATKDSQWIERARAASQAAVELDDRLAAVHVASGTVYRVTGEYEKAVAAFERALALDPASDAAYRGLGAAYEALNQLDKAEHTYRRAIEVRPDYWAGYHMLGRFYYTEGHYREAAAMFQRVVELTPDNAPGFSSLGGMYYFLGDFEQAAAMFRRSLEIAPTGVAYSNAGTMYFFAGNYPEAIRMFEKAVELEPQDYRHWGNLADAYRWTPGQEARARGAYSQAIALAREQLKVNPRHPDIQSSLSLYYAKTGEPDQAQRALRQALSLAPSDVNVQYKAAVVWNLLGDQEQSLAALEQAVRAGYS